MKQRDMEYTAPYTAFEQKVISWWTRIWPQAKFSVLFTFLFGFVAHGSAMFNKLSVHDDVAFTHSVGATVSSGRWMLEFMSMFERWLTNGSHHSMPLLNSLITFLCIGISVGLVISLLRIRSYFICAAIAGILVACPDVTSLLGFMFTAPYYAVSFLATVWGATLLCRYRSWDKYLIAVLCFTCGLGVYQAYIPVAISLILFHFILEISDASRITWKDFFRSAVYYASAIMISVLSYYILNKFFIRLFNEELSNYQGINKMGREGITVYLARLLLVAQTFLLPETYEASFFAVIMGLKIPYKLLLLASLVLQVFIVCRAAKESVLKAVLLTGAFLLVPLATNFIYVMCPDVSVLMTYGCYFYFVFVGCIADRMLTDKKRFTRLICIFCCVLLLLFVFLYCRYSNALYMNMAFEQQRTISYFNTMISQIKSTEGYRDELPVAYINFVEKTDQTLRPLHDFPLIRPYENSTELINDAPAKYFMDKWCGFSPVETTIEHPDIESMPCYPDDGSIRVIDDVVVVKFR